MTTAKKLMTAEELAALPSGDGRRYELLDGVLVEMAPNGYEHDVIRGLVGYPFFEYVNRNKLGDVLLGDTGYILRRSPDRVRAPDISIVLRERLPGGRRPKSFTTIVPDLLVEVVSPGDTAAEVEQKTLEWLAAGVRLVINVYPETRSVMAYRSPTDVHRYTDADTLDAAPVLPDFSHPVAQFFPEMS
jgi:Uma2 family endonuclease